MRRSNPVPDDNASASWWTNRPVRPPSDAPRLGARLRALLPRRSDYTGLRRTLRGDAIAGLTVAVVALPLALGFGVATGLGASAGLMTAVIAGLVAAVFGGSNLQVSGPTGAMTVVLVPIVARDGRDAVFVVGIMAGILVVIGAVLGLGRYLAYVPWPVIEGFTAGIAVTIFLQEVPLALGVAKPKGQNVAAVATRALWHAGATQPVSLGIVALVAAIMVIGPRVHRSLPAALIAVGAATALAEVAGLHLAPIGALPSSLPWPSLPAITAGRASQLFGAAVAVALLAALESLMSARVADGMADIPRHDPDRELFGQGLANIVSPLFGGLPATGAIARTAVNVRSGGRTRVAAAIHAIALAAVVLFGGPLVSRIPLAALAAVLMVTAVRMVERHNIAGVIRSTGSDALVFAVTALATVAFDLIFAVEVGIVAAALLALRKVARSATATETAVTAEVDTERERQLLREHIVAYKLDGALFFGAAQRFLTELTDVADVRVVILRMPELRLLDATGARALGEIVRELEARRITVLLKGPSPDHERILRAVGSLDRLAHQSHVFTDLDAAVAHARTHALLK